jgi:fatty-acyl-CoA synthase
MAQPAVNYTPLTPLSFLVRSAYVFPDKTAVVYKDTRYWFQQLIHRVYLCAR